MPNHLCYGTVTEYEMIRNKGNAMATKLDTGDQFPNMTLNLLDGSSFSIPGDINSKYLLALFYRGHW